MSTFEGTRAIGETQSPTGSDALMKSVGQVGIYTTGHLLQSRKTRMVSAVVTKEAGGASIGDKLQALRSRIILPVCVQPGTVKAGHHPRAGVFLSSIDWGFSLAG